MTNGPKKIRRMEGKRIIRMYFLSILRLTDQAQDPDSNSYTIASTCVPREDYHFWCQLSLEHYCQFLSARNCAAQKIISIHFFINQLSASLLLLFSLQDFVDHLNFEVVNIDSEGISEFPCVCSSTLKD
jgi:hypothetical protein